MIGIAGPTRTLTRLGLLILLVAACLVMSGPSAHARADAYPAGPTFVRGEQLESAVRIHWGPPGDNQAVTGYVACLTSQICSTVGPTDWSVTFTGLTNGQRYFPSVAATTSAGQGPFVGVSGGVLAAGVPGPPLDLTATSRPGGAVRLSWSGVDDRGERPTIYSYTVRNTLYYFDVRAWHQNPPNPDGAGFYFVDLTDLIPGATYETVVTATNNTGTSPYARLTFTAGAPFLSPGLELVPGQRLTSRAGTYALVLQPDGNVVVYHRSGRAVWHSWTWGQTAGRLSFQPDGNLVAYDRGGRALWHTDTWGHPDARLHLADDGRVILFAPDGTTLWSSSADAGPSVNNEVLGAAQHLTAGQVLSSPYGYYRLVMQPDGNAVVHRRDGRVVWHSWTFGRPGSRMSMQPDGNLVVYLPDRRPAWNAGTWGNPGSRLAMQDDGNLVVYAANGRALWSSMYGLVR